MTRNNADPNRARADLTSRIAALIVFVALVVLVIGSAVAYSVDDQPSITTTVVETSPDQTDPAVTTENTTSTTAPTAAGTDGPVTNSTKETTVTEPVAGSTETTTVTTEPSGDTSFWGRIWENPGFVIGAQLLVAALAAFVVGGLVQRAWLGVFEIKLSADGVELSAIPKTDVDKAEKDIIKATEVPANLPRRLADDVKLEDPRLLLLQQRIRLELEVRALAASAQLTSTGDLDRLLIGLQQGGKISAGLAAGLLALFNIGDRISGGAEIEPAVLFRLLELYGQAQARVRGVGQPAPAAN